MTTSLLSDMGLDTPFFHSTPTGIDTSTDFVPSLSGVTNPIYPSTPFSTGQMSSGSVEVIGKAIQDFGTQFPDDLAPLFKALGALGLTAVVANAFSGNNGAKTPTVEVTAKGNAPAPAPAEPAPAEPAPAEPAPEVKNETPQDIDDKTISDGATPTTPTETNDLIDLAKKLGIPAATIAALLKYGTAALAAYLSYKSAEDAREEAKGTPFKTNTSGPITSTRRAYEGSTYTRPAAQGGIMRADIGGQGGGGAAGGVASLKRKQPFYLGGVTDGMADKVPASIDGKRPAALSDGEFVIPADVVSHLGNGNSNAGAQRLYKMMDDIREARTGNRKQGIQINPNNFMPR